MRLVYITQNITALHTVQLRCLAICSVNNTLPSFLITTQTNVVNSTLSLKINVTQTNYLRVCGSNMKDSMKHIRFYLDLNATSNSATAERDCSALREKEPKFTH